MSADWLDDYEDAEEIVPLNGWQLIIGGVFLVMASMFGYGILYLVFR